MTSEITYDPNRPIGLQLRASPASPPYIFYTNPDGTEVSYSKRSFLPLVTKAGLLTLSFHDGTRTEISREGRIDVLPIQEFELIEENGAMHTIPVSQRSPGELLLEPLDRKIKKIEAAAAKALRTQKSCILL